MTFVTASNSHLRALALLRTHPWLAGASAQELDALAAHCQVIDFHQGQAIFSNGQQVDDILLIGSGVVNRVRLTDDGEEKVFSQAHQGNMVSLLALFTPNGRHLMEVRAATDGMGVLVEGEAMRSLCAGNSQVCYRMLEHASRLVAHQANQIDWLTSSSAEERVADYILQHAQWQTPQRLRLPLSRTQIAVKLGIRAETFSRILAKWRSKGYITHCKGNLRILDKEALSNLAPHPRNDGP
ncbi:Crp/Fnr family transcriptional regulator [Corticibacter populi]|nr:Crp/Fnr family transcriptional regulator [Corticibacter populi]RZS36057.1 CRP/FNR family transcriptional regulator [Corticibacter populi]